MAIDDPRSHTRQCRYYDTLEIECALSRFRAQEFLSKFVGEDDKLPVRRNSAIQKIQACGFTTCWYIEEEVRHHLQQGWATQGWLDEGKVRNTLHKFLDKMQAEEQIMRNTMAKLKLLQESQKLKQKMRAMTTDNLELMDSTRKKDALAMSDPFEEVDKSLPPLLGLDIEKIMKEQKKAKEAKKAAKKELLKQIRREGLADTEWEHQGRWTAPKKNVEEPQEGAGNGY